MSSAPTTWVNHYRGTPSFIAANEDRDLRYRLRDVVVRGHGHRLAKRDHRALEELVVVGGEGIGHKILADVAVRGLVEIGVGRLKAREKRETPRPIAAFFAELALAAASESSPACPPPPGSSHESLRAR